MESKLTLKDGDHHRVVIPTADVHHKVSDIFGNEVFLFEETEKVTLKDGQSKAKKSKYGGANTPPGTMAHSHTYVWQTVSFT